MSTQIRTVNIELTSDDTRYILHALEEFKKSCHEKIEQDEDGDGDFTHMYANDVMQVKIIYEKIAKVAEPVFGKESLKVSYELL